MPYYVTPPSILIGGVGLYILQTSTVFVQGLYVRQPTVNANYGILVAGYTTGSGIAQYGIGSQEYVTSAVTAEGAGLIVSLGGSNTGTWSTTNMYAIHATMPTKGNNQTVTNIYTLYCDGNSTTCTTSAGVWVRASSGGTANNYGVYIVAPGGTNPIGLYNGGTTPAKYDRHLQRYHHCRCWCACDLWHCRPERKP